jgi:protein gp37
MGETTGIGWTDHTANFWWGCSEVGKDTGCDNCYARIFSERMGKAKWGDHEPRMRTSKHVWDQLDRWNKKAATDPSYGRKVFTLSMGDFFENHPDLPPWRAEAWQRIKRCPQLRFQILTKRGPNISKMLPEDWGAAYAHVGFMVTVINQREADRDVPRLLQLKRDRNVTWVGLSIEPMCGALTFDKRGWLRSNEGGRDEPPYLDWIILGGESAKRGTEAYPKCRPYDMDAALDLITEVKKKSTCAVYHKQMGSKPIYHGQPFDAGHWKGEDSAYWPDEFKVQEFPPALMPPPPTQGALL